MKKLLTFILVLSIFLTYPSICYADEPLVPGEVAPPTAVPIVPGEIAPEPEVVLSDEEFNLLCKTVYSESNNQSEEGKRLVADTVLNRVEDEDFPDTVTEVIKQENQYTYHCPEIPLDIQLIVSQELVCRYNYEVLWFRKSRYHSYGTPYIQVGAHYFSK